MILSNVDIEEAIGQGEFVVEPFDRRLLKRNSYLIRLHSVYRRTSPGVIIDTANPADYQLLEGKVETGPSVVLTAESLVLGCSAERISVSPGLVGFLSGISNVARLGVLIHSTSNVVNAGFAVGAPSRIVFEMATVGGMRVRLYAGTPICHLILARVRTPAEEAAASRRTGQDAPEPSELLAQFGSFFMPSESHSPVPVPGGQNPVLQQAEVMVSDATWGIGAWGVS